MLPAQADPERQLAATPPMGWMSWNAFGRDLDERAVLGNAEALVRSGLRDAGFIYVCLDDHWHGGRGADGRLYPHPERFRSGIPALAEEIHGRGLKLGIYTCAGDRTCGGEPGSAGFEAVDAATFAEWGVDYVKDDYCHAPPDRETAIERYGLMGRALEASGREIVFAVCEWGQRAPWEWASSVGAHLWRTTGDVRDVWDGPGGIGAVADQTERVAGFARPGAWNDPDMLVTGLRGRSRENAAGIFGCTDAEYRTQLSLWAMMAAPFMASCDLRMADDVTLSMLGCAGILAIDQDRLGRAGRKVGRVGEIEVWRRSLSEGASAVALVNRSDEPIAARIEWTAAGGTAPHITDAWTGGAVSLERDEHVLEAHGTAVYRMSGGDAEVHPVVSVSA